MSQPKQGKNKKPTDPWEIVEPWVELDLTAAAQAGELPPAFHVDDAIDQVVEMMAVGDNPILVGERGVGKTAVVHELVRRAHSGEAPSFLHGRRFLQISLERFASGLEKPEKMAPEFQKLVLALPKLGAQVVPFFRDLQTVDRLSLEPQLLSLAVAFPGLILGEGATASVRSMFEFQEELSQFYFLVGVEEPSLDRVRQIVSSWSTAQMARFSPEALDQALHLSHRFLARSRQPRKVLDLLRQFAKVCEGDREITESDVIERFCANHRIPRGLLDASIRLDLAELEDRFANRILGQQEAVRAVVAMIGQIKAGLSDVRRPFGVFLFVGPTGVGKTHVAQLLADFLFGSREKLCRINMADYADETGAIVLMGNPNAHSLADRRGILTRRMQGQSMAVLLLDELEKAHPGVFDCLLQLIDEGQFINGAGETVPCRSTIIIATTNAGAELFRGQAFGFAGPRDTTSLRREVERVLEEHFRFEFLNRFDQVVHFQPLTREAIRTIALRELEQLRERSGVRQRKLEIEIDEGVLDWITAHGYDPDYGARFLRRAMERNVTVALADCVARLNPAPGTRIELMVRGNRVVARPVVDAKASGSVRAEVRLPVGTVEQRYRLDAASLRAQAQELLENAGSRRARLADRKEERSRLLAQMNDSGFWEAGEERDRTLARFRDLDVSVHVEDRLVRKLEKLEEALQGDGPVERLAQVLENAARALVEWEERDAEGGGSALWVVVSNTDPLHPAEQWIKDVVTLEQRWCRRVQLDVGVVGFEAPDGVLSRVALGVEGPGAAAFLAMEEGVHRLHRNERRDVKARVEIFEQSVEVAQWPEVSHFTPKRKPFPFRCNARGRLELSQLGVTERWYGDTEQAFPHLLHDLRSVWNRSGPGPSEAVRVYAKDGVGAVDPRTGASCARLKDALAGRLDVFLQAWRQREGRDQSNVAP